ncbi:hypothetical protein ILUMI_10639 [Ignelater luminosus]|uniref:DNA2/NAM7 helicase-like C-terminal domain-containing protein n=1 Tax=Ignelater luminosus TaxID=2038154 RepID=A0A8K0D012_IGNLU|nr:hypothetical protein ILUMI_10639 [Ignelater luminosus]
MEPEATIAMGLLKLGKQLVLAGDPKQLGPTCSSTIAENYKLGISLLERLMNTALYQSKDPNFITMLKLNFHSHPDILKLPNDMFYDGQLIAKSLTAISDPLAKILIYPLILQEKAEGGSNPFTSDTAAVEFCSVIAQEKREGRSPSYFNTNEGEMVIKYIQEILNLSIKVELSDIGVITPYIQQVHRIKERLKEIGYGEIEVGTPEVFQGREKRVIIISTVRAQVSLLLHDCRYKLGFVKNEKRFNVALTRAKSKLIVIGCPLVLKTDKRWLALIDFCQERNAYFGGKFDRRTDAERIDIINRISGVHFKDSQYDHEQDET